MSEAWLGLDYGTARVGAAIVHLPPGIATALAVLPGTAKADHWPQLDAVVRRWSPVGFVIGEPVVRDRADAEAHPLCAPLREWATAIATRYRRPVLLVDETLSSRDAERRLIEAGQRRWQRRKALLDAVAAQLVLQSYCDGAPVRARIAPDLPCDDFAGTAAHDEPATASESHPMTTLESFRPRTSFSQARRRLP